MNPTAFDPSSFFDAHIPRVQREIAEFWRRLPAPSRFDGARVLDFGSGLGCLSVDLAERGAARVLGLEIAPEYVGYASRRLRAQFPRYRDIVEYTTRPVADLQDDSFDVIISKDVLEHVIGVDRVLPELANKLAPGGQMLLGFGPLWHSMFGDHELSKHLFPRALHNRVRVPWLHLLMGEARLVEYANRSRHALGQPPLSSLREYGFNRVTYREFKRVIDNLGLTVVAFETNNSRLGRALTALKPWRTRSFELPRFVENYWCAASTVACSTDRITLIQGEPWPDNPTPKRSSRRPSRSSRSPCTRSCSWEAARVRPRRATEHRMPVILSPMRRPPMRRPPMRRPPMQ